MILPVALLLASCGQQRPGEVPRITEEERSYGAEQHPRLLAEFGATCDHEEAAYVRAVGTGVAAAAGLGEACTFTLVNSDVTRRLFAIVNSEAELASVLGHEVGRIVGRHAQRQQRRSLWRSLGVLAAGLTGSERLTRLAGQAAHCFTQRYSRGQEYQADELGVRYLQQAGCDVHAAAEMLPALGRNEAFMARIQDRAEARSISAAASLDRLFWSFRVLSAEEIARLRPRIIRIVAVQPQDTTDTMARQMADPAARDLFLMLNGLVPEQSLRPGSRVKIVKLAQDER